MDHHDPQDPSYHLRRVADHVPSMLAYWDRDLRCRFANRAYETWFGVDPDKLLGTHIADLLGPALFTLNERYIRGALAGQVQTFERAIPGPDGITRHSLATYHPDWLGGQVAGFIVTVTEITHVKQAEDRLRATVQALEAEARQRRSAEQDVQAVQQGLAVALDSFDAGFIAADRAGLVTRMNAVAERLTGWRQAQALGQPLMQVLQREDRPAELQHVNPVDLVAERGFNVGVVHQVTLIARGGERTPVEAQVALTHGGDGGVSGLAMVLRDRSDALRAEIDASQLAAIVESSHDAIVGKTIDGRITSWNAGAQALFGYSADEIIGRPVLLLVPPDRHAEETHIQASLARGQRVPAWDTVRLHRDGRALAVSVTISPIRDARGRTVGASMIARDITERKQAEAAARKAELLETENRQIQEASRLKSLFLANMSHELRTPLNAIIGFADLLRMAHVPVPADKRDGYLGHIASSGRHLLQLINDVLDLSKVESGKFSFHPEPLALPALVQEVQEVLASAAARKRTQVQVQVDPALPALQLDPGRLKQVLYNFLSNAIKFTGEGGHVVLRAGPHGAAQWRLEVEDDGIGIAAEQLPRLFVEFQQLDTGYSKQHQGTGLGLALTRRLVEAQGGSVGVRSQPGQGSVFHAVLPLRHAPADAAPLPASPAAGLPAQRLLIIEPDAAVQQRLLAALASAGFTAEAACSAEQALLRLQGHPFDGLMVDLQTTDPQGLSLLHSIRRAAPGAGLPVVGMTLPADGERAAAAFAITDILAKPLRTTELLHALAPLGLAQQPGACVLVIDDDPQAQTLMADTLARLGIRAVGFTDGRRALAEIDLHQPQALILDLLMPGFDGFQVLEALQRLPQWRGTPVFIWTSLLLTDDEQAALAMAAQAVVSKGGGAVAQMLERLRQWRPAADKV